MDESITRACRELLLELGYSALTIEAVAERAGVGRPTIYRRWPSKPYMVWDALFTTPQDATVIGDTSDLRADLELWVTATMEFFGRPEVARAFSGLLNDQPMDTAWHARLRDPVRKDVVARLRRAVDEGDLRPDADPAAIFDMVIGFAIYRSAVPQGSEAPPSPQTITDHVLRGAAADKKS
ncbi:TetR/AcrR family transcriptional regulator [Frankia sp. AgB1.9]|uniref:TetR/AcrR family transcriptional regulator n=1 Tax=unclassified Frankia TaxID=2632575 RepID=UPI001933D60A|nr:MULTISPECIES: TetR/AcrR family transcriptional regulator [unclassified Frankia]MBL7493563.1 TetR/AcrR family transcriptional regulator [Frankia sp. AgW1.1]MBL7549824.1 TetR/AcrR family transcriptional regulator [Frankia sp. AgB1.9]MBL7622420.1 TetR/AcrR family transcriptional regulator [Frankia sp. AgB1.8]